MFFDIGSNCYYYKLVFYYVCFELKGFVEFFCDNMLLIYKKEKLWDIDDVDKWKVDLFIKEDLFGVFLEEFLFMILFFKYCECYLKDFWLFVIKFLEKYGIDVVLDFIEGFMIVKMIWKVSNYVFN